MTLPTLAAILSVIYSIIVVLYSADRRRETRRFNVSTKEHYAMEKRIICNDVLLRLAMYRCSVLQATLIQNDFSLILAKITNKDITDDNFYELALDNINSVTNIMSVIYAKAYSIDQRGTRLTARIANNFRSDTASNEKLFLSRRKEVKSYIDEVISPLSTSEQKQNMLNLWSYVERVRI